MARMEVSCRRFATFGGMQIDAGAYAVCVHPAAPGLGKRGTLALITEPVGSMALEADACRLAQRAVVEGYFSDRSLGLTSSLLNALDGANNALLQYGSGWTDNDAGDSSNGPVALQNAVKTRRVRVGMTALLLRPDGTGVYLSQMAPTQAYILHNGLLSALPEPAGWTPGPGRTVVTLKRVLTGEDESETEDEFDVADLSNTPVPAPSLGSGPGVEADMVYRRIEPGDKIVLVSSGIARHIERNWAEEVFSYDADGIVSALAEMARDRGLGEAHACVLELGVATSSGVDTDYTAPISARPGVQIAQAGGVSADPQVTQKPAATLLEALKGPREWFSRRRHEGQATLEPAEIYQAETPTPIQSIESHEPVWDDPDAASEPAEPQADPDGLDYVWSRQPTQLFVQRSPEVPPYQAQMGTSVPAHTGDDNGEELDFDGWEDTPPALDDPRYGSTHNVIYKPKVLDDPEFEGSLARAYSAEYADEPEPVIAHTNAAPRQAQSFDIATIARKVTSWSGNALASIMPQRSGGSTTRKQKMQLPLRIVILAALAVVGVILVTSLLSMRGSAERTATINLLAEAQQLQTAANQPGLTDQEKIEKLQLALDKAQEAAADDPQSEEASRLVVKLSKDLDTAQGVTRLASLKVLFDLDANDGTAAAPPGSTAQTAAPPTTAQNDVLAQGNDVYVLDRAKNRVYRCQVAAKSCSAVLSAGDSIGGQTVGAPLAMTLRVGSPVVLDEHLISYLFSADTGAWTAEALGGAEGLQKPISIASYDGNLYLLGAKAGQVSKYPSGQYGQPPLDWIVDGPTGEAIKEPAAMAIDGVIYVALADGHIVLMQGGKMTGTFTPGSTSGMGAPTQLLTNTDIRDLYLLRAGDNSITRMSKEGQTLSILKPPTDSAITTFSGVAVDEGRSKLYLADGRKVYEAALPTSGTKTAPPAQTDPQVIIPQQTQPTQIPQPAQQAPRTTDNPSTMPTVVP